VGHRYLKLKFLLCIVALINAELKGKGLVDGLNSQVQTHPIFFFYALINEQIWWNSDVYSWWMSLDGQFIVEAKLLGAFAEASGHFEVEEGDSLTSHHFFLALLSKTNAVGHTSRSLYHLVDNIVTYRAILKTYYVHHAVRLHCVFVSQLLVKYARCFKSSALLGLAQANV
jgi:hypothetical protein